MSGYVSFAQLSTAIRTQLHSPLGCSQGGIKQQLRPSRAPVSGS